MEKKFNESLVNYKIIEINSPDFTEYESLTVEYSILGSEKKLYKEIFRPIENSFRDEIDSKKGFLSNNSGGTLGGITSGQDIEVSMAIKPTSSIRLPGKSINNKGQDSTVITKGRHDPCVGIRAVPIAESMLALVLMDHALRHKAQNL